jgi:hypothetical protein
MPDTTLVPVCQLNYVTTDKLMGLNGHEFPAVRRG